VDEAEEIGFRSGSPVAVSIYRIEVWISGMPIPDVLVRGYDTLAILRNSLNLIVLAGVAVFSIAAVPVVAQADSLNDALRRAYQKNPDLRAERARQRATDELVPTAKSGWRPTIVTQGSVTQTWSNNNRSDSTSNLSENINIQLSQPLFRGFKTVEGIHAAKAQVEAGRQNLLAVEQGVLFNAVNAYAAIVRDRQVLRVRQRNVVNLKKQVKGASARFEVGEVTRTDVSQAKAQLSAAQSGEALARANLEASIAQYVAVIGNKPGKLTGYKLAKIPASLQKALSIAEASNPSILAAAFVHDAALHNIEIAKGDLLPTVSLQASASYTNDPQPGLEHSESATIQGVVSVPLYQNGSEYSAVRQAKQSASQQQLKIIGATRTVRQQVTSSWYVLIASRQAIISAKAQVSASNAALDGINQEYLVGSRSTIDVLNAEQSVLNAQLTLINAEHDQLVASYQILASIGHLTARHLGLGGYYDVRKNYDNVKNKWIGLDADTIE
jgi:outer membrane protein